MTRAYHSASSAKLAARCERAWAYAYIVGLRGPETKAQALGKAVHGVGERYMSGDAVDWTTQAARIFLPAVGLIPRPDECTLVEVERPLGSIVAPDAPGGTVFEALGVRWGGFRDLLVRLDATDEILQIDYKTTRSIAKWALTPATLVDDLQACVYSLDVCQRFDVDAVRSRWVYLETGTVRRGLPVDAIITREHAESIVAPAAELCARMDRLADVREAAQNPDACHDYGGCPYHATVGGPCDARRGLRSLFERKKIMALDPALVAKFGAVAPPPPPPPPPAPAAPPPEPVPAEAPPEAPAAAEAAPEAPPAPPAKKRGRKPAPPKNDADTPVPPPGSVAEELRELVAELAVAEARVAEAEAARAEVLARIVDLVTP